MNRKSPQTPAAVSFFRHFLINFLRPYGIAYPPPTETEVTNRLLPLNCEWFGRPATAISEFASTIESNLELLTNAKNSLVKTTKIAAVKEGMRPFLDTLKKFNVKDADREMPAAIDVKTFLQTMLCNDDELDQTFAQMFELGGAMYLLSSHFHVVKKLLQNPEWFAETTVGVTKAVRDFKANPTIKGLKEYLTQTTCATMEAQRRSGAQGVKRNLAALLESDEEDVARPSTSAMKKSKKRKIANESDDDDIATPQDTLPHHKVVAQNTAETVIIGRKKGKGKGKKQNK